MAAFAAAWLVPATAVEANACSQYSVGILTPGTASGPDVEMTDAYWCNVNMYGCEYCCEYLELG